jgi:hypothetical protein
MKHTNRYPKTTQRNKRLIQTNRLKHIAVTFVNIYSELISYLCLERVCVLFFVSPLPQTPVGKLR